MKKIVSKNNGDAKYNYIASKDNTSVGKKGVNSNVDYNRHIINTGNDIMSIASSFIPGIGDVQDAVDLKEAVDNKDAIGIALSAVGFIPVIGAAGSLANKSRKIKRMKEAALEYYENITLPIYREVSNAKIEKLSPESRKAFDIMVENEISPDEIIDNINLFDNVRKKDLDEASKAYEYQSYVDDFRRELNNKFNNVNIDIEGEKFFEESGAGGSPGFYNSKTKTIYIRDDIDDAEALKVATHEIGHRFDMNDRINKIESGIYIDKDGIDLINKAYNVMPKSEFDSEKAKKVYRSAKTLYEKIQTNRDVRFNLYEMLKNKTGNEHPTLSELRSFIDEGGISPTEMSRLLNETSGYGQLYSKAIGSGDRYIQTDIIKDALKNVPSILAPYILLKGYDEFNNERSEFKDGGLVRKQREAYDYFTNKRGMSQIQALAILGNLMAESGLVDNVYGDNNTSYGIQQWHNERKDALFKYAKKKGHKEPTFEDQIEFLADEYEGKTGYSNFLYKRKGKDGPGYYNYSLQDFQSAESLRDAVIAWNQGAGRPHKSVIRNDDRYNEALNVAKNIGVEVDVSAPSLYGQMGYKDSVSPIPENTVIKEGIIEGKTANESATSSVENPEDEAMGKWVDTYGKDIIAQLMSMNGKEVSQSPEETGFDYKQYVKDEEEDKRRAIIQAVLPNIQLKIKGVTEVGK